MMTEKSVASLKIFLTKPGAEGRVGQGQGGVEGPLSVGHKVERRHRTRSRSRLADF